MNRTTRREFLGTSSHLGLTTLGAIALRPLAAWANPMGLPIGIQLYTVRGVIQNDTSGILKQLHDIGYREVETAGFGKYTAKEFGQLIKEAGLACPSAHLSMSTDDLTSVFEDAHALGATYATSPSLPVQQPPIGVEGFKKLAARMNDIGAKAKAAGLQYAYHNHRLEFEKMPDGSFGYDILLKETDKATVKFEIDCGWMVVSGASPVDYMKKNPDRIRMLHIKDFKAMPTQPGQRPEGCDLGTGFIDYKPIFATGKSIGIQHLFTEQEGPYTKSEVESAKIDYTYLHSFS
jgi:sugar phosphate isomerase/epimerase